jgi:hypothetical protein
LPGARNGVHPSAGKRLLGCDQGYWQDIRLPRGPRRQLPFVPGRHGPPAYTIGRPLRHLLKIAEER